MLDYASSQYELSLKGGRHIKWLKPNHTSSLIDEAYITLLIFNYLFTDLFSVIFNLFIYSQFLL